MNTNGMIEELTEPRWRKRGHKPGPKPKHVEPIIMDDSSTASPASEAVGTQGGTDLTLTLLRVMIEKDSFTRLPATIWEHELPILRVMYDRDQVQVLGKAKVPLPEGFSVRGEFARLYGKYNCRIKDEYPVERAYADVDRLAAVLPDVPFDGPDDTDANLRQSVVFTS